MNMAKIVFSGTPFLGVKLHSLLCVDVTNSIVVDPHCRFELLLSCVVTVTGMCGQSLIFGYSSARQRLVSKMSYDVAKSEKS